MTYLPTKNKQELLVEARQVLVLIAIENVVGGGRDRRQRRYVAFGAAREGLGPSEGALEIQAVPFTSLSCRPEPNACW